MLAFGKGKLNWCGQAETRWEGRLVLVHRVAMEIHLGRPLVSPTRQLDRGEVLRHKCDHPSCCNYRHFLLGTQANNIEDRDQRGHTSKGEHRYNSKLTEAAVREIRSKFVPRRYGLTRLAKEYKVNHTTIDAVIKRKGWRHVE